MDLFGAEELLAADWSLGEDETNIFNFFWCPKLRHPSGHIELYKYDFIVFQQ